MGLSSFLGLCAVGGIYVRKMGFMSGERDLCAVNRIYVRSTKYVRNLVNLRNL